MLLIHILFSWAIDIRQITRWKNQKI